MGSGCGNCSIRRKRDRAVAGHQLSDGPVGGRRAKAMGKVDQAKAVAAEQPGATVR